MKVWYVILCLFSSHYLLAQSNFGPHLATIPDKWVLQTNALVVASLAQPLAVSLNHLKQLFSNKIGKHIIVIRLLFIHFFSGAVILLHGNLNYTPQTTTTYAF